MKWKLFSIVIVLSFILAACNTTNEGMRDNDTDGNNVQPTRYNDDMNNNRNNVRDNGDGASDRRMNDRRNGNKDNDRGNMNNDGNMDNDRADRNNRGDNKQRYDVSEDAANKITDEVKEIDHAYVLTTKNNAYVAAKFNADGDKGNHDNRTDRNDKDGRDNDKGTHDNDRNQNDGANKMGNNDQMDNEDDRLTDDVKNEVSDIVKSVDDDIDNVYVSTNPDFIDLTSNYANDMGNGHPVRGFFDKMGDMVERLFPQNR